MFLAQGSDVSISDNHWLDGFRIPVGEWFRQVVDWVNSDLEWLTDAIKWPFNSLFRLILNENPARDSIMSVSWVWLVIGFFLLGSFLRNTRVGLQAAALVTICGFLGQNYWFQTSRTFGMIFISVLLCVIVGIPLGVICGRFDPVWNIVRPILDAMQVVHSFVWMIPFIFFFGTGDTSATIVTMFFAIPPLVRLTNLGIRQVPEDVVEASRSYGANELRVLTDVQLPLARPAIMTGLNQTLMLAISMLGIAAFMGAEGLGKLIFRAVNNLNVALAASAGLAFFLVAVVLDRISQPEDDDGLSLGGRISQAFAYRRDHAALEADFLAGADAADRDDTAGAESDNEPAERLVAVSSAERVGLLLGAAGALVAMAATFMTWGNNAGLISSWGRAADENLAGQSFNGLSGSGGGFYGILVLLLAGGALMASIRPMLSFPTGLTRIFSSVQGVLLSVMAVLVAGLVMLNAVGLAGGTVDCNQVAAAAASSALEAAATGDDDFVPEAGPCSSSVDAAISAALAGEELPEAQAADKGGIFSRITDGDFDPIETLAMALFALAALAIAAETFVRGTPRLGADGALILALGSLGAALGYLVARTPAGVSGYSHGTGAYVAAIGAGVAVIGTALAVMVAPYAPRTAHVTRMSFAEAARTGPGYVASLIGGLTTSTLLKPLVALALVGGGASAAWVVDEREGIANRVFIRGLSDSGPGLGMICIILGLAGVVLMAVLTFGSETGMLSESMRWRLGSLVAALGVATMAVPLGFTLTMTRNGDTDYFNDKLALTGAGILFVLAGGFMIFASGRRAISTYNRRKIYASVMQDATGSAPTIDIADDAASLGRATQEVSV